MSARDKLAEIISDAENCTDEEGYWALPEDVADAIIAAGYPRYGGRGIRVCDEWDVSFEQARNRRPRSKK